MKIVPLKHSRTSGSRGLSAYQLEVKKVLDAIAEVKPRDGNTVSETAIVLRTIKSLDTAPTREAVRDGFQLLTDMGIASPLIDAKGRRLTMLWKFHEAFGPADADNAIEWDGRDETYRTEGAK